ncbi:hypothetical protein DICPUDRAFT_48839 [Dictyostelium purpureum]|uniref:Thioredoxin domain-containing protein n=1 Tax=Dictyostelium purpureum TaxID=5786 RepID=F0ZQY6_DICPU|nr:uncharacterized protein DICPUDRAFT_48839 [Dictyostelium purpureum]EGC33663.1 hypothetical protein DICPUDRAFT_48839 [Dictyostelium purpureum]|eukprot:XP_003289833.1 hypothetical protein DICPUDRAFT_48839 [Dictyostelium purpureum]
MLKVGQKVPLDVTLGKCLKPAADGSCPVAPKVNSGDLFSNRRVVVFALPGAFTPTCSAKHLPGFIQKSGEIKSKNIDEIFCLATNDSFVMSAWGKEQGAGDSVTLISDGNSEFTKKIGMTLDATGFLMGPERSKRYAMILDDGVVKHIGLDESGFEHSSAEAILKQL